MQLKAIIKTMKKDKLPEDIITQFESATAVAAQERDYMYIN